MSQTSNSNCPIFIVGLPRSGSTLWTNILNRHPGLARFPEAHFLSPWHKDFQHFLRHNTGLYSSSHNVNKLLDDIFDPEHLIQPKNTVWFWNKIRDLEKYGLRDSLYKRLSALDKLDTGSIVRIIIEESTACEGKERPLVKFPVYPTYIGRLTSWWPDCRIVHISRDPRALATSKSNDPGGVSKLVTKYPWSRSLIPVIYRYFAVFQYIVASRAHSKFRHLKNYRLYQYEDLLNSPEETIKDLCDFCRLAYDPAMLNPREGQASSVSGKKSSGFDPGRASNWKRKLSPWEAKVIGLITRRSMRRYGYTPKD